jgi:type II secretory pathway pseudopilin PulG
LGIASENRRAVAHDLTPPKRTASLRIALMEIPSPLLGSPRPWRRARAERGATIVEVVIAATLLSFIILGALVAISRGMTLTNHARMVTLSRQVLQSAIEDLRLKNYTVISGYASATQPVDFTSTITSELLSSSFTRTMTLQARFTTLQASTSTQLGLIGVEVTVGWQEGTVPFTRSSRTYFSEKGLSDYIYVGF